MSGLSLYAAICRGVSPCFSLASGEAPALMSASATERPAPAAAQCRGGDAIPVRAVSGSAAGEELERRVFLSGAQGGGEQGLAVFPRALADVGSGAQERRDHEGAAEAHRKS